MIQSEDSEETELNIVPIIDCFTVLITYLLVAASFINLTAFDVGISLESPSVAIDKPSKDIPVNMSVTISNTREIEMKITGGPKDKTEIVKVPVTVGGLLDIDEYKVRLTKIKEKYPQLTEPSVTADSNVVYRDIVRVIESTKNEFKKVYLAGTHEDSVQ